MRLKQALLGVLLLFGLATMLPTFLPAAAVKSMQPTNYCTHCWINPYTYQWYCQGGDTQGDFDCECFRGNCALV